VKSRLLTGLTAAVMAVVMGVGGTARPAQAAVPYAQIAIAVAGALLSRGGGVTAADLERAKREIIEAINASRDEIIGQIDAIASAEVRACTDAATTKVLNIDQMDPITLALFTNDAVNCATLSSAFFDAVQTKVSADRIGNLLGIIYSIAMVGFAKVGFPTTDLLDRLIRSYEAVIVKLAPTCVETKFQERSDSGGRLLFEQTDYNCTAFNGDTGYRYGVIAPNGRVLVSLDRAAAENEATRNTSRAVAQEALPALRQLRASVV
jgi:hypothetical protein